MINNISSLFVINVRCLAEHVEISEHALIRQTAANCRSAACAGEKSVTFPDLLWSSLGCGGLTPLGSSQNRLNAVFNMDHFVLNGEIKRSAAHLHL